MSLTFPHLHRPPGRRAPRLARSLPWLVLILVALPTIPSALAAPASTPSLPHAPGPALPRTAAPTGPAVRSGTGPAGLPGANPTGEPFYDAAALALHEWQAAQAPAASGPRAALSSSSPPKVVTLPGPSAPRPSANGTVTGRLYDETYGRPVVGANVSIIPAGLTLCNPAPCGATTTDSTGAFSLPAPAGAVVVAYSADYYIANRTWVTVTSGLTTSLGVLYLVHDATVTGIVEDDLGVPQPIAGAVLTATSRDGQVGTQPNATTAANGSFSLPVPPMASTIDILSPGNPPPYLENLTYVNLTPYATLDLGVIHLEGGVPVTATLVDRVTGLPISNQTPSQMTVCTRRGGFCLPAILHEFGATVNGYGVPGPASIEAYAIGYLVNATPIADLPSTHTTVDLGTIYLTPEAVVEVSTNLTGGPAPSGPWSLGSVTAFACSLDDEEVTFQIAYHSALLGSPCTPRGYLYPNVTNNTFPIGTTALVLAPPLRTVLFLDTVPGQFPIADNELATATPLFPANYTNVTWVNGTPDRVTYAGSVNLTAGGLLSGNVSLPLGVVPSGVTVTACSTDVATLCGSGGATPGSVPSGCPTNPGSFCIAAPPGPDVVTVNAIGSATTNRTWVEVPRGCCSQDGHPMDIGWINLTGGAGSGNLSGTIVGQTGPPGSATIPVPSVLLTVEACPVGPPPPGYATPSCGYGVVNNATGAFNLSAPLGWDKVLASAPGYQSNWTWIDVTGNNSTGQIQLAPDAVLIGQVADANGRPVYDALLQACLAADTLECYGTFATNSYGQFNGTLRGGPPPWGTYEVLVSAPGYANNWIWTNTTPGAVTFLPTIVLDPIGSLVPGAPPSRAAVANGTVGSWVDGRLVDSRTGLGIPDALVSECPLLGTGCLNSVATTTAGGTFNVSVILGLYDLVFTEINYPTRTVYLNATSGGTLHLGSIQMSPDPWVTGTVAILPWGSLLTTEGLGAALEVYACDANRSRCDLSGLTNSEGTFNVSIPSGASSALTFVGRGIGGFGSAQGGFDASGYTVNANASYLSLATQGPAAPGVSIFGAIVGSIVDGSTWNATRGAASLPCGDCLATVTVTNSSQSSYIAIQVGGGGNYTAFLPSDGSSTTIVGSAAGFFSASTTVPGAVPSGGLLDASPVPAIHYGWVTMRVLGVGGSPLAYAFVSTVRPDPTNGTVWTASTLVRGDGYANVTAAPGTSVSVTVTSPGYFPSNLTLSVTPSTTGALGNLTLSGGAPPSVIWVNTTAQNDVGIPPTPTVIDAVTTAPIPEVLAATAGPSGAGSGSTYTNGLGQFLFYAAAYPSETVQLSMPGYDSLDLYYNTTNVSTLTVSRSLMVANGVVAGQVVAEPSGQPVYGAIVEVCPFGNACSNSAYTNETGVFWVEASRGFDTVTIVDPTFLTNYTVSLAVPPNSWQWLGSVPVYSFAGLTGAVRGLPSGLPIVGANVSVCSPFGTPTGPCSFWVPTDANGSFYLPSPPGTYILAFSAPGYNTSYLGLSLLPGENHSVGNIFLFENGSILASVVSQVSGAPVPDATAIACATYRTGLCSGYVNTTTSGAFLLSAPPGPVYLTTSAPGYLDNFTKVYVPSGAIVVVGPIALAPLSADVPESIAGNVTSAGPTPAPIPGALVLAQQSGTTVASTATGPGGTYRLPLPWGSYTIVAGAPGFVPVRLSLAVHANLTGISFALAVRTYAVSGVVRDATTGSPLDGVVLANGGLALATTSSNGTFLFGLPNGSYDLSATPPNATGGGSHYNALSFSVVVAAAPVTRTVELTLAGVTVSGEVVDAYSGLPVGGAAVSVTLPGSATVVASVTAATSGAFSLALGTGSYVVSVSAPGYAPATVPIVVPNATAPLTIALTPLAPSSGGGPAFGASTIVLVAALAVVVAAVAVLFTLSRRSRPPPPLPPARWTLEALDEPVDR